MTSDRFPVPVRSTVKSNFTNWCCRNLPKRALNALTVQASVRTYSFETPEQTDNATGGGGYNDRPNMSVKKSE